MTTNRTSTRTAGRRIPLTRARVLEAAVALADDEGLEALSMRKLGAALGVEAMSLYNHVANKDDLLDGIVDVIAGEFEHPDPSLGWRAAIRRCSVRAHEVLLRHPWSAALAESRAQPGPERLAYLEALLRTLRRGGFSVRGAYQVNLFLDSYVYGFTLQEVSWPVGPSEGPGSASTFVDRTPADTYPHMVEVAALVADSGWDPGREFEVGLDVILDGFERMRRRDAGAGSIAEHDAEDATGP